MIVLNQHQRITAQPRSLWNELIKFRDYCGNPELSAQADMLLHQYNTAGGQMIHSEIESFLAHNPI